MCVTLFIICSQTCQFYSIGIYVPCSLVVPVPKAAACVYQVLDICWIHDECDCPLQLLKYTQSSVGQPFCSHGQALYSSQFFQCSGVCRVPTRVISNYSRRSHIP